MDLSPSTTDHCTWIFRAAPGEEFESTEISGKWCIFRTPDEVDAAWTRIAALVSAGTLVAAKVSTRLCVTAGGYTQHVICVYTRNWRKKAQVNQVRRVLREAGFGERLGYKRDCDTDAGIDRFVYSD